MKPITQSLLQSLFDYDPNTGYFIRRCDRGPTKKGQVAGGVDTNGYVLIGLFGTKFKAHRLAWMYVYGAWPKREIDHINGNKTDNRLCNLREATREQNCQNRSIHKNNRSGSKGIHLDSTSGKWVARIQIGGKRMHLGYHQCLSFAKKAINDAREKYHGEFANHGERSMS